MRHVYLDNHSNTRVDDRVIKAMMPYVREHYGNAQSMHTLGSLSRDAIEHAREQVAALIGGQPNEVYFTASGSEANNLAVKGIAQAYRDKGNHIIVSAIEHFSVLYAARRLSQAGYEVTILPVDKNGRISIDVLQKALRPDTTVVSIQHTNTEIGTMQDIAQIVSIVKKNGSIMHTDAVAAAGVVPVNVTVLGVDALTMAGSAFYGPKGAAAVYLKKGIRITPQIDGGIQENGRRAGTENVPAIVGFGKAAELAGLEMEQTAADMRRRRDALIDGLKERIPYVYLNGDPQQRHPGNANFSVEFIEGEGMFLLLDARGIYVSSGSACASKALKMSHVLTAINVDPAVGQGSVLMTLSKYITDNDVAYVLDEFPRVVEKLRSLSPLFGYFQKTGQRKEAGPGTDYEHAHEHDGESE